MSNVLADIDIDSLGHLDDRALASLDVWWRASAYLTVGQIYLQDNVLLQRPLVTSDVKPRLLGHWGTSPGLAFVYAHASRLITATGQPTIFLAGPGHGGPAVVAAAWLEGTYTETYPSVTRDGAAFTACAGSSRRRAASPVTCRFPRRGRSTRVVASSATFSRMPSAR